MDNIPEHDRCSIPEMVLAVSYADNLLNCGSVTGGLLSTIAHCYKHTQKLIEVKTGVSLSDFGYTPSKPSTDLDSYFYWLCGSCTCQNNFRKTRCGACLEAKGFLARNSPLLAVAEEVALKSKHTEEAFSLLSQSDRHSIPNAVLNCLVTCIAVSSNTKRRCRKQKIDGFDYCVAHCDPSLLSISRVQTKDIGDVASSLPTPTQKQLSQGVATITKEMPLHLQSLVCKLCCIDKDDHQGMP